MAEPEFATTAVAAGPAGDGGEIFASLTATLEARSLGVSRLKLQPRRRRRVHLHERQEELYFVLSGALLAFGAAGEHVARETRACGSWDEDGPGRSPREVPYPPDFES